MTACSNNFTQTHIAPGVRSSGVIRIYPMNKSALIFIATITVLFGHLPHLRGQDELSREELLTGWKTVAGWDRAERSYKVKQANILNSSKPPGVTHVKVSRDAWAFDTEFRGIHTVYSRSPLYAFALIKQQSHNDWQLRHYEKDVASADAITFENTTGQIKIASPLDTFITLAEGKDSRDPSLSTLSESKDFLVKRIARRADGLFDVEISYKSTSGILTVDRLKSCLVVQSELRSKPSAPNTRAWALNLKRRELYPEPSKGDVPRCKCLEVLITFPGDAKAKPSHEMHEFYDYSDAPIAQSEFMLSHYGIPEPQGVEVPKRVPNYVWLLIAAAVFGSLALAIRFFAKRRARATGGGNV